MRSVLFPQHHTHTCLLAMALAVGLAFLPGCENQYSDLIQYRVRTDPVFLKALEGEQVEPDRPGQLPLTAVKQVLDPTNPFYKFVDLKTEDRSKQLAKLIPGNVVDPTKTPKEQLKTINDTLGSIFGTPRHPRVDLDPEVVDKLKLDDATLTEGSRLYRQHCLQCHGVPGDGRGATAAWVNPHPRDFRQGIFKFMSVDQVAGALKPTRSDLHHTLLQGVEGTAMPAFNLMPEKERDVVISYVIHLAIRGETEYQVFKSMKYDSEKDQFLVEDPEGLADQLVQRAQLIGKKWIEAETKLIRPVVYPARYDSDPVARQQSIRRGHALFTADENELKELFKDVVISKDGKVNTAELNKLKGGDCKTCHVDYGRLAKFRYDEWGTLVRPRNLTEGVYRGGRRPVDLYYRIHSGIKGVGMSAFGANLKGEQIWDLVNFVQAVPYRRMLADAGVKLP